MTSGLSWSALLVRFVGNGRGKSGKGLRGSAITSITTPVHTRDVRWLVWLPEAPGAIAARPARLSGLAGLTSCRLISHGLGLRINDQPSFPLKTATGLQSSYGMSAMSRFRIGRVRAPDADRRARSKAVDSCLFTCSPSAAVMTLIDLSMPGIRSYGPNIFQKRNWLYGINPHSAVSSSLWTVWTVSQRLLGTATPIKLLDVAIPMRRKATVVEKDTLMPQEDQ